MSGVRTGTAWWMRHNETTLDAGRKMVVKILISSGSRITMSERRSYDDDDSSDDAEEVPWVQSGTLFFAARVGDLQLARYLIEVRLSSLQ